ncbi:MAG: RNA 2'-phosphotransferase [Deltaproteobacteria bacterium]|nr:RNA 2'-phosphotransferase [Deltaproteobacteria bacterium]
MGRRKDPKELKKLMTYVLGRHPEEFGLVPDEDGFFHLKDLIKAISEEPGWGYVRKSHIHEVLITFRENSFIFQDERIKVANPDETVSPVSGAVPPKLLYHCVRQRAYPLVCEKGIMPMGQRRVFLATTEELALRMGRRRDQKPVLLTVQAKRAYDAGVIFSGQGELIYLVDRIPVGYFSGPSLPKEKRDASKPKKESLFGPEKQAGSFILDMERSLELHQQKLKRKGVKKEISWKKDSRRSRRKHR